jgi:hypothetical protein
MHCPVGNNLVGFASCDAGFLEGLGVGSSVGSGDKVGAKGSFSSVLSKLSRRKVTGI